MPVKRQHQAIVTNSWTSRRRAFTRGFRAGLRDTRVLIREFREAILLFSLTLLVGGLSFFLLWNNTGHEAIGFAESLYEVLGMTFLQPSLAFPDEWYLQLYFFLMPALGLAILARGAADFVSLLFNRRARQSEWEEAVASVAKNHIIVCGLGHLGIRVLRELVNLEEDVVVIEFKADSPRFPEVRKHGVPIIVGDARHIETLEKAGLEEASAIIICTSDDLLNLQIATRIRECSETIRVIMRMFDEEFAKKMSELLNIEAVMSASLLAAPAFAGAATRVEILQTFKVDDRVLAMGRVEVAANSKLHGARLGEVEDTLDMSVVLWQSGSKVDVHPEEETILSPGDVIAVVAAPGTIRKLASEWNRRSAR
jgi:voltage-gated potassium channel